MQTPFNEVWPNILLVATQVKYFRSLTDVKASWQRLWFCIVLQEMLSHLPSLPKLYWRCDYISPNHYYLWRNLPTELHGYTHNKWRKQAQVRSKLLFQEEKVEFKKKTKTKTFHKESWVLCVGFLSLWMKAVGVCVCVCVVGQSSLSVRALVIGTSCCCDSWHPPRWG